MSPPLKNVPKCLEQILVAGHFPALAGRNVPSREHVPKFPDLIIVMGNVSHPQIPRWPNRLPRRSKTQLIPQRFAACNALPANTKWIQPQKGTRDTKIESGCAWISGRNG
jgi:hypothetical protein